MRKLLRDLNHEGMSVERLGLFARVHGAAFKEVDSAARRRACEAFGWVLRVVRHAYPENGWRPCATPTGEHCIAEAAVKMTHTAFSSESTFSLALDDRRPTYDVQPSHDNRRSVSDVRR